jgi:hypothetical protein
MEAWDLNLKDELERACSALDVSDSLLITADGQSLHECGLYATLAMLSRDRYGVYVSVNRPQNIIHSLLSASGADVERVYFVDCVSALAREILSHNDFKVAYANSPERLDGDIPDAINLFLDGIAGEKFLIIDALRTLFIYNEPDIVSSFIHSLLSLTKTHDLKLIVLSRNEDGLFLSLISHAFDEVHTL